MKNFKLILGLSFSLLVFFELAIEQQVSANLPGGDISCADTGGCKSSATCAGRGTAQGCSIMCEGGGVITCGPN